ALDAVGRILCAARFVALRLSFRVPRGICGNLGYCGFPTRDECHDIPLKGRDDLRGHGLPRRLCRALPSEEDRPVLGVDASAEHDAADQSAHGRVLSRRGLGSVSRRSEDIAMADIWLCRPDRLPSWPLG